MSWSDFGWSITPKRAVVAGAVVNLVSAACGVAWYLSLPHTSVAANATIYQSASVLVFVFSFFLLQEPATLQKMAALALCVGGVAAITFSKQSKTADSDPTVMGYVWLLVSVALYALYEVLFKIMLEPGHSAAEHKQEAELIDADDVETLSEYAKTPLLSDPTGTPDAQCLPVGSPPHDVPAARGYQRSVSGVQSLNQASLLPPKAAPTSELESVLLKLEESLSVMGLMALWNMCTYWPIFFILDASGLEPFEMPAPFIAKQLAMNAGLDSLFTAFMLFGVCITTPLVMALGSMNVVPVSVVADWAVHGSLPSPLAFVGIVLVLVGFAVQQLTLPWSACSRSLLVLKRREKPVLQAPQPAVRSLPSPV